jgi:hypothetical protein
MEKSNEKIKMKGVVYLSNNFVCFHSQADESQVILRFSDCTDSSGSL